MVLSRIPRCMFNRHAPRRSQARWDGLNFVSTCKHCDKPIRRVEHGVWKLEWMDGAEPTPVGDQ